MTDTRKDFEEVFTNHFKDNVGSNTYERMHIAWQACQQLNNKRIADLEATIRNMAAVIAKKDEALIIACSLIEKFSLHVVNGSDCMRIYDAANLTADGVELVEVTHLKFRAVLYGGNHEHGPESHEWLEQCSKGDVGDDGIEAFPVYTIKTTSSPTSSQCQPQTPGSISVDS